MVAVASAASTPTSFALSEDRNLRFVMLFLLYVAQGLPFGLIAALAFAMGLASASLGWLDSLGRIPAMFTAMAVCSLTAAAFAFAAKVGR